MESNSVINIVVWAEDSEAVNQIASQFGSESEGVFSGEHEGSQLRVYTRVAGGVALAHPQGVADALIVSTSGKNSSFFTEAREYINTRRGIPCKFLHSAEDLSEEAYSLDTTYLADLSGVKSTIVSAVKDLEVTLRTAFNALDLNGNGVLTSDELQTASANLGHFMNPEEAELIVKSLSSDNKITYPSFKTWWVRGRGDFSSFRNLVKLEMDVYPLIKKGSEAFNNFIQNLIKEESESGYKGNINIGPVENFETGFGLSTDVAFGNDYDEVVKSLPDYFRSSPVSFSIEFPLASEEGAAVVHDTLSGFSEMIDGLIPPLAQLKDLGLKINVRSAGKSVYVDVVVGGMLADQVQTQLGQFNFAGLNFSGNAFMNLFTGLRLSDLLNGSLEENIARFSLFKVESHAQVLGVKNILSALVNLCATLGERLPRKLRELVPLVKLLAVMKVFNFEYKYDANELSNIIKELVGEFVGKRMGCENSEQTLQALNSQVGQYQGMVPMMVDNFKPMMNDIVEPFVPCLKELNLDRLGFVYCLPHMRMYYKLNLHLPGVTQFVKDNVIANITITI